MTAGALLSRFLNSEVSAQGLERVLNCPLGFRVQGLGFKVATRVADARLQWWGSVVAATFKGAPHEPEEGLWPPSVKASLVALAWSSLQCRRMQRLRECSWDTYKASVSHWLTQCKGLGLGILGSPA